MAIIVGSGPAARGGLGLSTYHEAAPPGRRQDGMLRALVTAGMSEETAAEQIARLSAGDIWSG
jgi:hypothetical protein